LAHSHILHQWHYHTKGYVDIDVSSDEEDEEEDRVVVVVQEN
jgi:hypothetical protein